ncbi:MAG: FapA family protein [Oscillospiraceae bacterium]|nr:FapA family protein [Oscillospiraceae bacterium]
MAENEKFLRIDGRVEITCDNDGRIANMFLHSPQNGGAEVNYDQVCGEIARLGITTNIDESSIKRVIKERLYGVQVCIATAISPKKGKNGYISFRFDKEHKLKPRQNEFGIADYRELNAIVPIHKNEIIADIVLPEEGVPGMNIFGKELPAEQGEPAKVSLGKNTLVTTDGTKVVSACDGHIVFGNGCFQVENAVTIKTDLDISVGNISFFGDVHIKGNVMEGFSINAGKNVKIDGSVFGGEINAGGNVTIVGGCINSKLTCDGNADIGFCENAEIFVKGDVTSKQFAFCDVFCYGGLTAKGTHGVIAGGKVTSMHDISAGIIGSEKYTATEVYIGDGSVLFTRRREAEADLKESARVFDAAVKNLAFLKQRKLAQGGELTEAQSKAFRTETQNKLFHSMRKNELQTLIDQLDEDIKNKDNLSAKVSGVIYPGVKFCVNFLTLDITETMPRSRVTIIDDKLMAVPL